MKGDTGQNLIGLLERRLDAVVYRAKFAPTIWAARQIVNHGQSASTARSSTSPRAKVNVGDVVELGPQGAGNGAGDRGAGPAPSATSPIISSRTAPRRSSSPASRRSTKCPIRCAWSRTWSSSSTRADRFALRRRGGSGAPFRRPHHWAGASGGRRRSGPASAPAPRCRRARDPARRRPRARWTCPRRAAPRPSAATGRCRHWCRACRGTSAPAR